jgi:hypothetical protein
MLFFGHSGLTLGAAELLAAVISGKFSGLRARGDTAAGDCPGSSSGTAGSLSPGIAARAGSLSFPRALAKRVDYRLVLLGSLLPDIIDKPLDGVLLAGVYGSGRIFGHTLVFSLILVLWGIFRYTRSGKAGALSLSFGTLMHLLTDEMWEVPRTLFWPLLGWSFEKGDVGHWVSGWLHNLLTNPEVYIPEILGAIVIAELVWRLLRKKKLSSFLCTGSID